MHVYENYGGTDLIPGQKLVMNVSEFENFAYSLPLVNDIFVQRDAAICFNLAMMTQINEIDSDRHLNSTFIEFLEAFCRCAEKASFPPPRPPPTPGSEEQEIPEMPIEQRKKQPMHVKIENTLPYLIKNCAKRQFIDK